MRLGERVRLKDAVEGFPAGTVGLIVGRCIGGSDYTVERVHRQGGEATALQGAPAPEDALSHAAWWSQPWSCSARAAAAPSNPGCGWVISFTGMSPIRFSNLPLAVKRCRKPESGSRSASR